MELKVIVPTSLSEITLEQYQRFARLEGDNEFLTKKSLEIFCNVPLEQLPNVRFKDVSNVFTHINAMMREKPSLTQRFTLKGQEFGFIPSLEDITYGEFVDLDSYMSDSKNLIREMQNYKWQEDKNGNLLNKPIDAFNHAIDATRYATFNRMSRPNYGRYAIR